MVAVDLSPSWGGGRGWPIRRPRRWPRRLRACLAVAGGVSMLKCAGEEGSADGGEGAQRARWRLVLGLVWNRSLPGGRRDRNQAGAWGLRNSPPRPDTRSQRANRWKRRACATSARPDRVSSGSRGQVAAAAILRARDKKPARHRKCSRLTRAHRLSRWCLPVEPMGRRGRKCCVPACKIVQPRSGMSA